MQTNTDLTTLIHKQIPWINAFNNTNKEITINALYKYFGE